MEVDLKMKVCFLVSEHPFLDARIFKKEAKSLFKKGYEVTMIVPKINGYLFQIDGKKLENTFELDGFFHEGIKVITYDKVFFEKKLKSLKYNIQSSKYNRFSDPLTILGIEEEADIYHAHEFFSLYSGIGIKRALQSPNRKKVRLIYDSHELDPDPLSTAPKLNDLMLDMLQSMLKEVDYVITVSESIKSWFRELSPTVPVEVIYNSPPFTPYFSSRNDNDDHVLVAYEGLIHERKGNFKKLIKITDICNQEMDLRFRIIGGAKERDKNRLNVPQHLTDKIELLGWMDYDSLPTMLANVHLGWIDLQASTSLNHRYAMPNKFFSYLNSGIPVLVNQCIDMDKFIRNYQCGYVVQKQDATAEDYAAAILTLYKNKKMLKEMGQNGRKALETFFSWEHMEKRLYDVYERIWST